MEFGFEPAPNQLYSVMEFSFYLTNLLKTGDDWFVITSATRGRIHDLGESGSSECLGDGCTPLSSRGKAIL